MMSRLLFIGSFLVTLGPINCLTCIPCNLVQCASLVNCKGGLVKSICGCCSVCARVEGEKCGGQWQTMGRCDAGLKCVVRDGRLKAGVGTCEPAVCRGKKCGFREVCTLGNDGFPICTCSQTCGKKRKPVCGYSNGKQYNNECELFKEECRSGSVIGVMRGPCKKCSHGIKTYSFGETRTGKDQCETCNCFHGEWRCHSSIQCQVPKLRSCRVDALGRNLQSDCPRGFWCKVQIPGIPEANIPDVAVCVPGDPTNVGEGSSITTTKTTTVSPPASRLQGKIPSQCLLPRSEGPCRAAFQRWYYDKEKGKCMSFLYGGCEGNANNFYTKPACKVICMQQNRSSLKDVNQTYPSEAGKNHTTEQPIEMWKEVCYLPPVAGPCRASFPRWYFNPYTKKCVKFTYGGCKGNMNKFYRKVDCKKHCMRRKAKTRARAVIWYGALRRRATDYKKLSHG